MDKYDYVTATIEEEKDRLENIINYLKENNNSDASFIEYSERYNNIIRYLNFKSKYLDIKKKIDEKKKQLEEADTKKDEYEIDNILLEDTLLNKFNQDTLGKYRNILYEEINEEEPSIREILYLMLEKQSNYHELINKREKLLNILDKNKFPMTYETLNSQEVIIKEEEEVYKKIYIIQNSIKALNEKIFLLQKSVMTEPILKILYEFWIIDSYDANKVDTSKLFEDNRSFINIKEDINYNADVIKEEVVEEEKETEESTNNISFDGEVKEEDNVHLIPDLKLPGIDEDSYIDIDGKDYVNSDK